MACSADLSRARTVAAHQAYLGQGDAKVLALTDTYSFGDVPLSNPYCDAG